jgi:hypothetical protein
VSSIDLPRFPEPDWFDRFEAAPATTAYGDLEDLLQRAEREGVLDLPAESPEAARRGEANTVRTAVVAERLWLLGYLAKRSDAEDPGDSKSWRQFLDAVRRFQGDAGLKADRWVGEKTWRALQQLVSFETPTEVRLHAERGMPGKALIRATRLRLWALGLLSNRPTPAARHDAIPTRAIGRFWLLVRRLGMAPFDAPQPELLEAIERLFDQDRLVSGAAASSTVHPRDRRRRAFTYLGDKRERRQVDPQVRGFLVCLVKVELWLLGFDVDIDGQPDYLVVGFEAARGTRKNRKLRKALGEFWRHVRRTSAARRRVFTERITPELFGALADPPVHKAAAEIADDYSLEASETIRDTRQIEEAWREGKSLGMRLWDGLKRIWRWLSRGVRKILDVGKNLLRGFYRYALKAFQIVRFSARVVARSIAQYLRGWLDTGEPRQAFVSVHADGDFATLIAHGAIGAHVREVALGVRYFGIVFQLCCRILALIADVIRNAATGAVGWARLIWDLVRGYRSIRPLYRQARSLPRPVWA